ncbi:hypothetical protein BCR34DRAFT_183894 [Clohesyomyces aquaticus]|uniref:Geranylgeranyl pyrophosphate synthetase n=1 Tax=Clohesyomyces aquaticus TaxID=1231657 RepID=A0A1Y1ZYI9_9PLEO|nr:hypothetical protein BCR34DRAFT_183894 [Clohesyomyces aquaticus]
MSSDPHSQKRARPGSMQIDQTGGKLPESPASSILFPNPTNTKLAKRSISSSVVQPLAPEADHGIDSSGVERAGEASEYDAEGPKPYVPTRKLKKKMEKQARIVSRDAGDRILSTIYFDEITASPSSVTWDSDPELLCCYNWLDEVDTNTIFVPGGPPKWVGKSLPFTLPRDTGYSYTDYNYVRQPRDPYSPMFNALSVMRPDFCFNDVDVIADRNNLRLLLEFVSGKANGPFRLDVFVTLNTLMLVRSGENFWKNQDANTGGGYGGNFEKQFTRPGEGLEDATSHYRAIRYPMGPLNVVCRFEADAYYDGEGTSDGLTSEEADMVKGGLESRPQFNFRMPIRVLQKGHVVPTAQVAELKSTVYKKSTEIKHEKSATDRVKCMDQLWFGRTSCLIIGQLQPGTGTIEEEMVQINDAAPKIKMWEERQQENLQKLVTLLTQLRATVKQEKGPIRAAVLAREERAGPIVLRSKETKLPIVKREFFERHWKLTPAYNGPPQFGRGRGRGLGGRGFGRGTSSGYQRGGAYGYGQPAHPYAQSAPQRTQPAPQWTQQAPQWTQPPQYAQPATDCGRLTPPTQNGRSARRSSPDYGRGGGSHNTRGGRGRGDGHGYR